MSGWRDDAACKGKPWQWWINTDEGLAICRACPVQAQCLEDQLAYEQRTGVLPGIFGGTTPRERSKLRRQRGIVGYGPGAVTLPVRSGAPAKHGTPHAYRHHGCRCAACCQANHEAQQRWHENTRLNADIRKAVAS